MSNDMTSFLRASGGVSGFSEAFYGTSGFSPRERRCFWERPLVDWAKSVFSARAEVFPRRHCQKSRPSRFLRASGGVSRFVHSIYATSLFSPCKRRCFWRWSQSRRHQAVFSAQAEVFPGNSPASVLQICFLRASGGVSINPALHNLQYTFSPRKRRCF